MFKLALRNIKSKPWRTVVAVFGIAVAVAMIFAMLSFRSAVFDYISASETAVAGSSDIKIATKSSSTRITTVTPELDALEVQDGNGMRAVDLSIYPSLYIYAQLADEYVQARGFDTGEFEALQKLDLLSGSTSSLNTDDVIISKSAAEHFGVDVGSPLTLSLGSNNTTVYVAAIAKNSGYFLDDSPYLIVGECWFFLLDFISSCKNTEKTLKYCFNLSCFSTLFALRRIPSQVILNFSCKVYSSAIFYFNNK